MSQTNLCERLRAFRACFMSKTCFPIVQLIIFMMPTSPNVHQHHQRYYSSQSNITVINVDWNYCSDVHDNCIITRDSRELTTEHVDLVSQRVLSILQFQALLLRRICNRMTSPASLAFHCCIRCHQKFFHYRW